MAIGMRWIGLLLASAFIAAGCAMVPESSTSEGPGLNTTDSPGPAVSVPCGGADLSVDRGPYMIAGIQVPGFFPNMGPPGWQTDDVALRDVVVVGRVTAKEEGVLTPRSVYTPFAVQVDEVIHGDARVGPMVVAVEGGTVGCYSVHVDVAPLLEPGTPYVLFVTAADTGTLAPGYVWDAWPVDGNNVVSTYQGPMSLRELVERIDRLSAAQSSATP